MSKTRGIVKLIPKKDSELILIKNWRSLTLLNCDYTIASKAIASRIKNFLPKLMSDDQTGFLKGRCISERIRLLDSVIKYTEGRNQGGGGRDEVWDRETMFSQLAKRSPRMVVSG